MALADVPGMASAMNRNASTLAAYLPQKAAENRSSGVGAKRTSDFGITPSRLKARRMPSSHGSFQNVHASGVSTPGSASAVLVTVHSVSGAEPWWTGSAPVATKEVIV